MQTMTAPDVCEVPMVHPERVSRVQELLSDEASVELLADTFATMADPTRLRILDALSHEELCVCDLSAALNLSQSSTSHHLRTLRNLRLVKHRREGRLVYYSMDDDHIVRLFALGLEPQVELLVC